MIFAGLLLVAAVTAVIAALPASAWAVGAPADNYTVPDIPTDNTTSDEIKPDVQFIVDGPSVQDKNAPPGMIPTFTSVPERDNNLITAGDKWFLDIDINAPGWIFIWEYYPKGSTYERKRIAWKWHLKEIGVWNLGPFKATGDEPEGQHIYRICFYSGGKYTGGDHPWKDVTWTYLPGTPQFKIVSFEINSPDIKAGEATLLFWEVQGASSVDISGMGSMAVTSGTAIVKPEATTTYVLTARDAGGKTLSQPATVTVRPLTFAEQAMKFLGNPVILIMAAAAVAIIALAFVLLRRRQAAQNEAKKPVSSPTPQSPEKTAGPLPQIAAKAVLELPGGLEIRIAGDTRAVGRADLARGLEIDRLGQISRQHFRITFREEQFFIEDPGSAGGTLLNGTDIRERGEVILKDDDLIEPAGAIKLRFRVL
jgi:hypothetical protein